MIQITLNFATVEAARKALNEIPESLLIGALPTPKTEVVKSTVEVAKERAPKPAKAVEEAPAPAPAVEPPAPTAPIAKAVEETKADVAPEIDYPTLQKAVFTLAGKSRDAAKAVADTGNRGVGGHLADEDTGDGHHKARGDDRREGQVHRFDDRVLFGHFVLELHESAGRDDCIVDVRAHLDGRDDQIAQEEQEAIGDGRDAVVDPDAALNDHDQQHRDTG